MRWIVAACMVAATPVAAASAIPDGTYAIAPARTSVQFRLKFFGLFGVNGDFSGADGTLAIDWHHPDAIALAVRLPVDTVHSVSRGFAAQLRSARWLDAADFPEMRFASTGVRMTGPGEALVTGDLTLHGITHVLVLRAQFHGGGTDPANGRYAITFDAVGKLRRSDYGMKTLLPVVSNDVRLTMNAAFERDGKRGGE